MKVWRVPLATPSLVLSLTMRFVIAELQAPLELGSSAQRGNRTSGTLILETPGCPGILHCISDSSKGRHDAKKYGTRPCIDEATDNIQDKEIEEQQK